MTNSLFTTQQNTSRDNSNYATTLALIFVTPICVATFALNTIALVIVARSQKLRNNKFYRLTMYLSISDIISSISSFFLIANMILEMCAMTVPVICFGSTLLSSFTITFSMIQVLLICIERLIATFPVVNPAKWTFKKTLGFVFILLCTAAYTSSIHFRYGDITSVSCDMSGIFGTNLWKFQLSLGIVHLALFIAIFAIYAVVVYRMYGANNTFQRKNKNDYKIHAVKSNNTETQCFDPKVGHVRNNSVKSNSSNILDNRNRTLRHACCTLGILIAVMILSDLVPVTFHLISAVSEDMVSGDILKFTNGLFIINPLCDPIIYVFRIKEYRRTLKSSCRKVAPACMFGGTRNMHLETVHI